MSENSGISLSRVGSGVGGNPASGPDLATLLKSGGASSPDDLARAAEALLRKPGGENTLRSLLLSPRNASTAQLQLIAYAAPKTPTGTQLKALTEGVMTTRAIPTRKVADGFQKQGAGGSVTLNAAPSTRGEEITQAREFKAGPAHETGTLADLQELNLVQSFRQALGLPGLAANADQASVFRAMGELESFFGLPPCGAAGDFAGRADRVKLALGTLARAINVILESPTGARLPEGSGIQDISPEGFQAGLKQLNKVLGMPMAKGGSEKGDAALLSELSQLVQGKKVTSFKSPLLSMKPQWGMEAASWVRSAPQEQAAISRLAGLPAPSRSNLSPTAFKHLQEREKLVSAMKDKGVVVDLGSFAGVPQGFLTRKQTVRDFAASMLGIPPGEVCPEHYELLLAQAHEASEPAALKDLLEALKVSPDGSAELRAGTRVCLPQTGVTLALQKGLLEDVADRWESIATRARAGDALPGEVLSDDALAQAKTQAQAARTLLAQVKSTGEATGILVLKARTRRQLSDLGPKATAADVLKLYQPLYAAAKEASPQVRSVLEGEVRDAHIDDLTSLARQALSKGKARDAQPLLDQAGLITDGAITSATGSEKQLLIQARVNLYMLGAEAGVRDEVLADFRQKHPDFSVDNKPWPPDVKAHLDAAGKAVERNYDRATEGFDAQGQEARTRATRAGVSTPEGKAALAQAQGFAEASKNLAAQKLYALSELQGRMGDSGSQLYLLRSNMLELLGAGKNEMGLLEASETRNISSDSREVGPLSLFAWAGATKVGFLSEGKGSQVDSFLQKLQGLPPARQELLMQSVSRYAEAAAASGNATAMNVGRQLLKAVAAQRAQGPDLVKQAEVDSRGMPPEVAQMMLTQARQRHPDVYRTEALMAEGRYLERTGNLAGARDKYTEACAKAAALPDKTQARALEGAAVQSLVRTLAALAKSGPADDVKRTAANQLRTLRTQMETAGSPLGRSELAHVIVQEMKALVDAHLPKLAEEDRDYLKKNYVNSRRPDGTVEVPWLHDAVTDFERKNKEAPVLAFTQVLLSEANSASELESFGWMAGGAAIGASVALIAATGGLAAIPLGAAVVFGVGAGGIALLGKQAYTHRDAIAQAYQTGLASETLGESLMAGGIEALNLAGLGAEGLAAKQVGKAGLRVLLRNSVEAADPELKALLSGKIAQIEQGLARRLSTDELKNFKALPRLAQEQRARLLFSQELQEAVVNAGGKTLAGAGMALLGLGVAKQLTAILSSNKSDEDKRQDVRRLISETLKTLVKGAPLMLAQGRLQHFGTYSPGLSAELRTVLREASRAQPQVVMVEESEFAKQVLALTEAKILAEGLGEVAAKEARAQANNIIAKGTGVTDPVTGNVLVSKSASDQTILHEVSHTQAEGVSVKDRQDCIDAMVADPNAQQIVARVLPGKPHLKAMNDAAGPGGMLKAKPSPQRTAWLREVFTEYQAYARSLPAGEKALHGAPLSAAMQKAGIGAAPKVDLRVLRDQGVLQLGTSFRPTSGHRQLLGDLEVGSTTPLDRSLPGFESVAAADLVGKTVIVQGRGWMKVTSWDPAKHMLEGKQRNGKVFWVFREGEEIVLAKSGTRAADEIVRVDAERHLATAGVPMLFALQGLGLRVGFSGSRGGRKDLSVTESPVKEATAAVYGRILAEVDRRLGLRRSEGPYSAAEFMQIARGEWIYRAGMNQMTRQRSGPAQSHSGLSLEDTQRIIEFTKAVREATGEDLVRSAVLDTVSVKKLGYWPVLGQSACEFKGANQKKLRTSHPAIIGADPMAPGMRSFREHFERWLFDWGVEAFGQTDTAKLKLRNGHPEIMTSGGEYIPASSPGHETHPLTQDLLRLKRLAEEGDPEAPDLARQIVQRQNVRAALAGRGFDEVVAVPSRKGGRDAAQLLAEAVAAELGVPIGSSLRRQGTGVPQKEAGGMRERILNVADAFVGGGSVAGRRVLVVDDIMTSGATLTAAAKTIRDGGGDATPFAIAQSRRIIDESPQIVPDPDIVPEP